MIRHVVLSGGETNKKSAPKMIEADVVFRYLHDRLPSNLHIHCETKAISTRQNIEFAHQLMILRGVEHDLRPWIIFCDRSHALKVRVVSNHVLRRGRARHRSIQIESYPVSSGWRPYLKQAVGTAVTTAGLYVPSIGRWELARRQRIIAQS